jgi:hypothetical protein
VLLVTDGAPNCNDGESGCSVCTAPPGYPDCTEVPDNCLDDVGAIAAVEELAAAGIPTWVIGYELAAEFREVLDRMAIAGATGRTAHIPVRDRATLETAMREIGGSVVSCEYELSEPPGDVRYVRVTIDGETIPHESVAAGAEATWRLDGDRTVVLVGAACERLRDGAHHALEIRRECTPVLI